VPGVREVDGRAHFAAQWPAEDAMHKEAIAGKAGNFAVCGCYLNNQPRWLGVTETYEEAVKLQGNMTTAGWTRVAIFDAARQEVKEKPATAGA
jgi:hypothetical protein